MTQEDQWAIALARTKHAARRMESGVDRAAKKEETARAMNGAKSRLLRAMREKNTGEIAHLLETLYTLRAEQAVLQLADMRERYGRVDPAATAAAIRGYFRDCLLLSRAV